MKKLIVCAAALALPWTVNAATLKPGVYQYKLNGASAATEPSLLGSVILDETVPFAIYGPGGDTSPPIGHGSIETQVVRGKSGTLTFQWRINNDPGSVPIGQFLVEGTSDASFPVRNYEVNSRTDSDGSSAPVQLQITEITTKSSAKASYYFLFFRPVLPGSHSRFFFFKTTATELGPAQVAPLGDNASSEWVGTVGPIYPAKKINPFDPNTFRRMPPAAEPQ